MKTYKSFDSNGDPIRVTIPEDDPPFEVRSYDSISINDGGSWIGFMTLRTRSEYDFAKARRGVYAPDDEYRFKTKDGTCPLDGDTVWIDDPVDPDQDPGGCGGNYK